MAAVGCNHDDKMIVDNPYAMFNEVNDFNTQVTELVFDNYDGYKMVDVNSNVSWELNGTADWISISNHSGSSTQNKPLHLKVSVTANKGETERTAEGSKVYIAHSAISTCQ